MVVVFTPWKLANINLLGLFLIENQLLNIYLQSIDWHNHQLHFEKKSLVSGW